jgi:hypothetical protein
VESEHVWVVPEEIRSKRGDDVVVGVGVVDDEVADDEVADDEVADDEVADDEVADDEVVDDEVATGEGVDATRHEAGVPVGVHAQEDPEHRE